MNYATLMESSLSMTHQLFRSSLVELLEKMDDDFRHSPNRVTCFYVKVKRPRTSSLPSATSPSTGPFISPIETILSTVMWTNA